MGKAKSKGGKQQANESKQKNYPMVSSDICFKCQTQCAKGIAYLERMFVAGAIGKGVVCKKG